MIDWQQIDTVLLDMDGTLLDLHFDTYFWREHLPRRYAEEKSLTFVQAKAHVLKEINNQRGQLNWYCIDFWSQRLELDIMTLKQEITHLIQFRPQSEIFLQQLKALGYELIMVTNAHRKSLELKQQQTSIEQYFDHIFSAHDFKLAKENRKFWQVLQKHLPFKPESTLLMDDSLPVLHAAKYFGIAHLLTILTPDSQQPPRTTTDTDGFAGINCFQELNLPASGKPILHSI